MKRSSLLAIGAGLIVITAAGGGYLWWRGQQAKAVRYVTADVSRGSIRRTITASGSVNPEVTVQVGAFISGTIKALYCDYNTTVRRGQLCAKIDPGPYETAVAKAQADLDTQKAQLVKDQAALALADLRLGRGRTLHASGWDSQDTLDGLVAARNQANAQIQFDRAQIQQSQAALKAATINLNYTDIVSPVDGTVVSRNVNVGQTVASSFQTPTLFLIAKDLKRMQVDTNVSESDVGGAAVGARASFTVDAFPGRTFRGQVVQVRQAPISVQNVITYDAVIAADNSSLLLKPGMTATTRIIVAERRDVLRVPAQALTFNPTQTADQGQNPAQGQAQGRSGQGRRARGAGAGPQVGVLEDGQLRRVPVTVGLDDDANVEITGGQLKVGDKVVVSASRPGQAGRNRQAQTAGQPRFGP
ncbi:MAG TPA: efflux RND transporter periplasmic adaptor subunit [Caulobacteraceae bacterium]|nr:efflux RND transporter periplasmic adaptor subunit [Caulobacteraceae bacterium]